MKLTISILSVASAALGYIILHNTNLTLWLKIVLTLSVALVFTGIFALLGYLDKRDYFIVVEKKRYVKDD